MKRRVVATLFWLSLALLVTTTFLWVRSVVRRDIIELQRQQRYSQLIINYGGIRFIHIPKLRDYETDQPFEGWSYSANKCWFPDWQTWMNQCGFTGFIYHQGDIGTASDHAFRTGNGLFIFLPLWSVVLASAMLPTLRFRSWFRHRRRLTRGLCPTCGYDLRATPDRCPECGSPTDQ